MNKRNIVLFIILGAFAFSSSGLAQEQESAWRVINQASVTIVPDYNGEANPFPMNKEPEVAVTKEIDYEALARAELRATLINELRDIIKANNAYQASFYKRKPRGRIKGIDGEKVLIGKEWLSKGEQFEVSVIGISEVLDKLDALREIDPKSAEALEGKVKAILPSGETIKMTIIDIKKDSVFVRDSLKKEYTLNFE